MTTLEIIFEDEHLLILNKPPGILSVPGKTEPHCLLAQALDYNPNIRVIHRLDMATSGIMLFAKDHPTQKAMGHLFEQRKVHKCYQALVTGKPVEDEGAIELPLICDWPNRPKQKVCFETGKHAKTLYSAKHYFEHADVSLVHLSPVTGRSHQLRVHCLSLGNPILGDQLYNENNSHLRSDRLMLHAAEIQFNHPISEQPIHIEHGSGFEFYN